MRPVTCSLLPRVLAVALLVPAAACSGSGKSTKATVIETELELSYDDGQPAERPILAAPDFEWLIKFEPNLPAYTPRRLRLLVAQPGELRLILYRHDDATGRPGARIGAIERTYDAAFSSGGHDGKWLSEPITGVPVQTGPLWVGISVPRTDSSAARLWASKNESAQVFQRDAEPATALQSGRLPVTPMVRLLVVPEAAPPPPASSAPASSAPASSAPAASAPAAPAPAPASPAPGSPAPTAPAAATAAPIPASR